MRRGYLTPTVSGAKLWAKATWTLPSWGSPTLSTGKNQKWPPHPFRLGGPNVCKCYITYDVSRVPNGGKTEVATSTLPAGRKLLCGGGGDTEAHFPNPPPSLLGRRDGRGRSGRGCPTCRAGGGGVNPTSMAQIDTHVALIILTTQMCVGGGNYWWKKLFRAKFCVPAPLAPTSVLTQNKGPDTEPHFSNPPPSFGGRPCHPPPPPRRAIFRSPLGAPLWAMAT